MNPCFMNRPSGMFLLAAFLLPSLLTLGSLELRRAQVREAVAATIRKGLPPAEVVRLSFSIASARQELDWEHSREFAYRGQMYDIIAVDWEGDSVHYTCYWDHAESLIKNELRQFWMGIFQSDPLQQAASARWFYYFTQLYCWAYPLHWPSCVVEARLPGPLAALSFSGQTGPLPLLPPPKPMLQCCVLDVICRA